MKFNLTDFLQLDTKGLLAVNGGAIIVMAQQTILFTDFFDDSMNGKEELFSREGCKMTAAAKVASQATGTDVGLYEINTNLDSNKDGLLTDEEITSGLNNLLDKNLEMFMM